MILKINQEIEFWESLKAHSLVMAQQAREQGMIDEVAEQNYFGCNAVVTALKRLLK